MIEALIRPGDLYILNACTHMRRGRQDQMNAPNNDEASGDVPSLFRTSDLPPLLLSRTTNKEGVRAAIMCARHWSFLVNPRRAESPMLELFFT